MAKDAPTQLSEGLWYLPAAVNTFILEAPGGRSVLIDTGQDKDYARRLLRASRDALGLEPAAIINTHAHSDHFGGNDWLLKRLPDTTVHAPAGAATVIREPYLQPGSLWYGANPPAELLRKWTHAKPSRVDEELSAGPAEVAGVPLTFIEAPGHARDQLAVLSGDVLIAADGLFGRELLEKYPLPFAYDPGLMLESFGRLGAAGARVAVPGHGAPEEPAELARLNRETVGHVTETLLELLEAGPATGEELLAALLPRLGMDATDLVRYQLNQSTLAAWLAWLRREERADCAVSGNRLVWHARQLPY